MWNIIAALMEGIPTKDPYFLELDEAVRRNFPDVECATRHGCGIDLLTQTSFWRAGTDKQPLSDYKAKLVHSFVRGYKAGKPYIFTAWASPAGTDRSAEPAGTPSGQSADRP